MVLLPFAAAAGGRVVAIGDVHGSISGLTTILAEAGLIDADLHWTGGDATLVQTGDLLDRGVDVREVLELLMRLQEEAADAGGRVEVLLGNHETMNLTGNELLAGTRLPVDQYRRLATRNFRNLAFELQHCRRITNEPGLLLFRGAGFFIQIGRASV